jgi:HK97 gp10 family phage protein
LSIKLVGMEEILREIEKVANDVEELKERALDKGAEHYAEKLSHNTPRSNIAREHAADNVVIKKEKGLRQIGYAKEHFYMMFQELGYYNKRAKRHMPAKPIAQNTLRTESHRIREKMADELKRGLNL